MNDTALRTIIGGSSLCTLATIRRDGRPQLSQVGYAYDPARDLLRVSVTDTRAKTRNLRRDPRGTVLVHGQGRWQYAVAEVRAELLPITTDPGDASAEELVDLYRTLAGEHPDWDEFRAAMISEARLPLHLHVERVYGIPPQAG